MALLDDSNLIGQTIGHFRVQSLLGAGGMGRVYKAEDVSLGRPVALKILPAEFAASPDRVARFVQEAKAASALNHPAVITVYEFGKVDSDGRQFMAMEYIDGLTLRDKLSGRVDLKKALDYLTQAAEGLAVAHAAGVTHRDLKPDNIMVTSSGHVKILDFGLAKLREQASSQPESDATAVHSSPGMIVGTAGYMSPEQASGQAVDHRSDIFSFGCIVYEVTTGRRPFSGPTTADTLHAILREQPKPPREIDPSLPSQLDWLIRKCLAKDPDERYQSMKEISIDLRELRREMDSHPSGFRAVEAAPRRAIPIVAIVIAFALIAVIAVVLLRRRNVTTTTDSDQPLHMTRVTSNGNTIAAAISPDGKYVAYGYSEGGQHSLWVRQLATGSTLQLVAPQSGGLWGHQYAPDGNSIYYGWKKPSNPPGDLFQIPTIGGEPRHIATGIDTLPGFSPDGKHIVFGRESFPHEGDSSLIIINADGSNERTLMTVKKPQTLSNIFFAGQGWSPDGTIIAAPLFAGARESHLIGVRVSDGARTELSHDPWTSVRQVVWRPDGHSLIVIGTTTEGEDPQLWEVSYPEGTRRRITHDLAAYRSVSVSADGKSLVAVAATTSCSVWLQPVNGKPPQRVSKSTNEGLAGVSEAMDGTIAFTSLDSGELDVWTTDQNGGKRRQVTHNDGPNLGAAIAPAGSPIVYAGLKGGHWSICRINADGSAQREIAPVSGVSAQFSMEVGADGRFAYYSTREARGAGTFFKVPLEGGPATPLFDKPVLAATLSPDGKTIAYGDAATVGNTLIIEPLSGAGVSRKLPISGTTYTMIRWSPDGKGVYHNGGTNDRNNVWYQPADGSPARRVTNFNDEYVLRFDVSRDGKEIVMSRGTLSRDAVLLTNF